MKKATREQTKTHNLQLILKTIYDQGSISRADIARLTHLTRTTVSDAVTELIGNDLVIETGQGPSAGGKPPILLTVADNARHLIGLDLASDEFRGAVINLRGEIKYQISLSIDEQNGPEALSLVHELLAKLLSLADKPILGIGIGTPGLMDAQRGVVVNSVNLGWYDLPMKELLRERYSLPVYMANDCQVAALGEFTFGTSKDIPNLILIKIGRGIGAGVILDRQLYYGDGGFGAGEIGHVSVVNNGERCRCGHDGCLETIVSSRAIIRHVRAAIAAGQLSPLLDQLATTPEDITFDTVQRALEAGDPLVQQVIAQAGFYLGRAVANLVGALGIRHVVIGGNAASLGQALIDPAQRQVKRDALAALADATEISISSLGPDIVLLGAAALVLSYELGII